MGRNGATTISLILCYRGSFCQGVFPYQLHVFFSITNVLNLYIIQMEWDESRKFSLSKCTAQL